MNVSPENSGTVRIDGASVSSFPYYVSFSSGQNVQIQAVPGAGYRFDHWAGDLTGSANPAILYVNCQKTVTAVFTPILELTVSVYPPGGGQVKVNGSLVAAYPGTISFPSPATARVEAVPATGYRFDQWSGDLDGSANPSDLVVDSRKNVQANFLPLVHSTITPEEAQVMMQTSGNVQTVDVREASEYCSGHIPGSVNYPWNSGVFQLRYGELQKNRPVLLICRSGVRADRAGRFLDSMGYPLVYVMQGGMVAWASDIEACEDIQLVHFPYVVSDGRWETEIAIINTSAEDPLEGVLIGYRDDGEYVSEIAVDLPPRGRFEVLAGDPGSGFESAGQVRYAVFTSPSETVAGYAKWFLEGVCRAASPAFRNSEINQGPLFLPHVESNEQAATGLALLNTSRERRVITVAFNDGTKKSLVLESLHQRAFSIRELFDGRPRPSLSSAVIENGDGVIGVALFARGRQLGGIPLKDDGGFALYNVHVAGENGWETDCVVFNTSGESCDITIKPYGDGGEPLEESVLSIEGESSINLRYPGAFTLPEKAGWFEVTSPVPVTGLTFFRRVNLAACHETLNIDGLTAILPKMEKDGATGIGVVNIDGEAATLTVELFNDEGGKVAVKSTGLEGRGKIIIKPAEFFGNSVSEATYLVISSTGTVAAFQLNASRDGSMLDALPGL